MAELKKTSDLRVKPSAKISRGNAVRSLIAGRDARLAGRPVQTCPYDLNGTLGERFNGMFWVQGWRRAGEQGAFPVTGADIPR